MTTEKSLNEPNVKSLIEPILTLSTAHLGECLVTPTGQSFMDEHASMSGKHGWLLWTGGDDEPMFLQRPPADLEGSEAIVSLREVLRIARAQGCSFVMFDGDGEIAEQLMTFEW